MKEAQKNAGLIGHHQVAYKYPFDNKSLFLTTILVHSDAIRLQKVEKIKYF